jgi:hypothetical protein
LTACCQISQDLVPLDAPVRTHAQGSRVYKRDTGTRLAAPLGIRPEQHHHPLHEGNKAAVADQLRKRIVQVDLNLFGVVILEIPVATLMKVDHYRHDFAIAQPRLSPPLSTGWQQALGLLNLPLLAKVIDIAKQSQ